MSKDSQVIQTFSFTSTDADVQDDGAFLFHNRNATSHLRQMRVNLGSFEFPISQYPVDGRNNTLYLRESQILETPLSLKVKETRPDGSVTSFSVLVPATTQEVDRVSHEGNITKLHFKTPHGVMDSGDVESQCMLIGTKTFVSLSGCRLESDNCIHVTTSEDCSHAYLYHFPYSSAEEFCEAVTKRLRSQDSRFRLVYDRRHNSCKALVQGGNAHYHATGSLLDYLEVSDVYKMLTQEDHTLFSSSLRTGWRFIKLSHAWYAPSSRTFNVGQPLRIQNEMNTQLNRLHIFPSESQLNCHIVVRVDGKRYEVPVMNGIFTPASIVRHLNRMFKILPDVTIELSYEDSRFAFACTRNHYPYPFSILFDAPNSIESRRLGFASDSLCDKTRYKGDKIYLPDTRNHYILSENTSTAKMTLEAATLPTLTGLVVGHSAQHVTIKTFLAGVPFVCNAVRGSLVCIECGEKPENLLLMDADFNVSQEQRVPIEGVTFCQGFVEEVHDDMLKVAVHLSKCRDGGTLSVRMSPHAFNVASGIFPSCVANKIGIEHGCHASVDGQIVAKNVYNFDHPDYVLIYVEGSNGATTMSHQYKGSVTSPLTKLVLYPHMREERMLPRDMTITSGASLKTFRLYVRNPDGTLYDFNGSSFSFSLNVFM